MSLGVLVVVVTLGVMLVVGAVHYSGRSRRTDRHDTGEAILSFSRAYPGEAVRSIIATADGEACFLRLADGKTGFLQAMGRHYAARLIPPGAVSVEELETGPGFRIAFRDSTLKGGDYVFSSTEEAAEVSLWLCGGFALANPGVDGPEG